MHFPHLLAWLLALLLCSCAGDKPVPPKLGNRAPEYLFMPAGNVDFVNAIPENDSLHILRYE